jgi:hypothetical protein
MAKNIDLNTIFQSVTKQLSQKKGELNEADTYNHDHGDHMVQIFDLIQNAVSEKSGKSATDQLAYASEVVEKKAHSGSAALYAQGLSTAAKNLEGKDINADSLELLVKGLLNVGQSGAQSSQPADQGGLLGSLLSGLTGNASSNDADEGLGVDELLRAGLAFYQSKQDGDTNTEAIMDAMMAASPMGQSAHRSQSGSLVAQTIMDFASKFKN